MEKLRKCLENRVRASARCTCKFAPIAVLPYTIYTLFVHLRTAAREKSTGEKERVRNNIFLMHTREKGRLTRNSVKKVGNIPTTTTMTTIGELARSRTTEYAILRFASRAPRTGGNHTAPPFAPATSKFDSRNDVATNPQGRSKREAATRTIAHLSRAHA